VSDELGGEEGLRALASEGLGVILDIVPNHMGAANENRWWPDPEIFDVDRETGFYRRFFDIDDLAAVRMERSDVFTLMHGKVLQLVADGVVDGVRVDHPDGLADPAGYFRRLRDSGAPHVWIEKILHPGEPLRRWPVDGTVGYEFLVDAQALFVDPAGEGPLTELYAELTGETRTFDEVAHEAKVEMAMTTFHREVDWLQRLAPGLDGIVEALAALPVYRTYVEPWSGKVDDLDRRYLEPVPEPVRRILLLEEGRGRLDEFVTRFQQTTPPVTAKGVEDTAFYRYNRLLALNEVGGDPGRFGIGVDEMHAANAQRAERFPRNLLITSTHDTKRSADVRARIGALAGPLRDEFAELARFTFAEHEPPNANEGWMVLQNLLGAHPIEPLERLDAYIEKALREAKVTTSWVDQDHDHEQRVIRWARGLLSDSGWRARFDPLVDRVAAAGERSALGQLLLKLTAPGIPDVYGGDELDFRALVDPDNRRPVDFGARRSALAGIRAGAVPPAADPKLFLIERALGLRAGRPAAFDGAYTPVDAGPGVMAYTRGDDEVLVVIPVRERAAAASELDVDPRRWRDVLGVPLHGLGLFDRR
jgi:(1->4)-alpha-D-glucan 1-alpha-D-glucosylmutase